MSDLKHKVAGGAIWVVIEKLSVQVVSFVVSMVLARLLTPHDYGTVALLSIFMAVANSITNCGLGNALVQRKHLSDLQINSVFYVNIVVSVFVYSIMFMVAPAIAKFYNVPELVGVTRVLALNLIFGGVSAVQSSILTRDMLFQKRLKISLFSCLVSSVTGIILAYYDFGVWALVFSALLASFCTMVAYWGVVGWRPQFMFSFSALGSLFCYGWKLSVSWMIHTVYTNLYGFFVGKYYTPADLAFVNKGRNIPELLMNTIDGTIIGVSFPALAQLQENHADVRRVMRKMIQSSTFLVFPLLTWLAVCADSIILLLFGEKWLCAVPYMRWFCLAAALEPFCSVNVNAISAIGRSDVFLLLEIIKKGTGFLVMMITVRYGVLPFVIWMAVIMSPFSALVNMIPIHRLLGYSPVQQIRDVLPSFLLSCGMVLIMVVCGYATSLMKANITYMPLALTLDIILKSVVGMSTYIVLAIISRNEMLGEYLRLIIPVISLRCPCVSMFLMRILTRTTQEIN